MHIRIGADVRRPHDKGMDPNDGSTAGIMYTRVRCLLLWRELESLVLAELLTSLTQASDGSTSLDLEA